MHKPIKYAEKAFTYAAGAAWAVFDKVNQIRQNPGFIPAWSEKPLLKSYEKTKPPLGWPRETDSLCPRCVPEIRKRILDGETPVDILYNDRPGEIKAQVIASCGHVPRTNRRFWRAKILANRRHDRRVNTELRSARIRLLRF